MRLPLSACQGLDTRPNFVDEDAFTLDTCSNVEMSPGGDILTRPGLQLIGTVSELSKGLYSRGGQLHAAIDAASLPLATPPGFSYDGLTGLQGTLLDVLAAESFGVSPITGPYGVILVATSGGPRELHWQKIETGGTTRCVTPFSPGYDAIKIANKIVVPDPVTGQFNYCSSLNGPRDFTALGDAGFENAVQNTFGSRQIVCFGIHDTKLAVLYDDALQLWTMDEDPAFIRMEQFYEGPGTQFANSTANVRGNLVYLGRGGFTSLLTQTVNGRAEADDLGDRIRSLTIDLPAASKVTALWHERKAQYMCFVDRQVFVWHFFPRQGLDAWTRWDLPVSVDAATVNNGDVCIRSGASNYKLADGVGTDEGFGDIAWSWQSRPFSFYSQKASGLTKALRRLTVQQLGTARWTTVLDGREILGSAVTVIGSSAPVTRMLNGSARRIALKAAGTGAVTVNGLLLEADAGGL
jgi:hypothetical protein